MYDLEVTVLPYNTYCTRTSEQYLEGLGQKATLRRAWSRAGGEKAGRQTQVIGGPKIWVVWTVLYFL